MRVGEVGGQNTEWQNDSQLKNPKAGEWQEGSRLVENWREEGWPEEDWREEDWREEERKERERQQRRRQRIEEMKRERQRRERIFRYGVRGITAVVILSVLLLVVGIVKAVRLKDDGENEKEDNSGVSSELSSSILQAGKLFSWDAMHSVSLSELSDTELSGGASGEIQQEPKLAFEAHTTENTNGFSDSIISEYGIMIDVESGEVLAQKNGWDRINPASMTKILTVLVAAEHMEDLEGTFTMTIDITDYSFRNGCSNVGFDVAEEKPVRDLFYGTILPSGADAALGLAYLVAGSQEAFVDMMNEKLVELGLSETTHFTNCVGLYNEDHYSTPYDMAVILKEATDNEFCRQVLSEHHYVTTSTAEHPDGIDISNWFLRRIEDRDTHGEVLCGKTGYVVQSKNCAASLATDHDGREYICVTAGSSSVWTCIRDQVELYQRYLSE